MTPSPAINVTQILQEMDRGHSEAADQLLPLVYEELRRLASFQMAKEVSNHTLQPTALVHEAYLRLDVGIKSSGGQVSDPLVEPCAKGGVVPLVVICINLRGHSYLSRVGQA